MKRKFPGAEEEFDHCNSTNATDEQSNFVIFSDVSH